MKCSKCQTELLPTARFCPNCGTQAVDEADLKEPQDVTMGWLEEVFRNLGYTTEIKKPYLLVQHNSKPNMGVEIAPSGRLIGFSSNWKLEKPPSFFAKGAFAAAINKANQNTYIVHFSANEDLTSNGISTTACLWLCHKISGRDIADFIDTYAQQIQHLLDLSGLRAFA